MKQLMLLLLLVSATGAWFYNTTPRQPRCDTTVILKLKEDVTSNIECCAQSTEELKNVRAGLEKEMARVDTQKSFIELLSMSLKGLRSEMENLKKESKDFKSEIQKSMSAEIENLKTDMDGKFENAVEKGKLEQLKEDLLKLEKENEELKLSVAHLKEEHRKPQDCQELLELKPGLPNGVYTIFPESGGQQKVLKVYCDMDGKGWTVLLKRFNGAVDFSSRKWEEMKNLVGDLFTEHWIGLMAAHYLTSSGRSWMLAELQLGEEKRVSLYQDFVVGAESDKFRMSYKSYISAKSNTTSDALAGYSNGAQFSTYEADHDTHKSRNYAALAKGPGWFLHDYSSHPFGPYLYRAGTKYSGGKSMLSHGFNGYATLSALTFKVRRTAP